MRKPRVPLPGDPVGPDGEMFTFVIFLDFMIAYWKHWRLEFRKTVKGRATFGSLVLILLDYLRIRVLNLFI